MYYLGKPYFNKGGDFLEIGKRGPKTDNPKNHKVTIKLDQASKDILDRYSEQFAVSLAETIRRGLKMLEGDLKP